MLCPPPTRSKRQRLRPIFAFVLGILFLSELLGNGPILLATAFAAQLPAPAKGVTTYQQFMKLGRDKLYHGALQLHPDDPTLQTLAVNQQSTSQSLPSAEPAKMQPIRVPLTPQLVTANQTGSVVKQVGSDQRLEVQVVPGALDVTQAKLASGATPANATTGGLTLQVTQKSGHYAGVSSVLGTYELQLVDSQGHVVQGVTEHKPISFVYHYQPGELQALGIDPDRVVLAWPNQVASAQKAKKSTAQVAIPMTNDSVNHTLTAQSNVVTAGVFTLASLPTVQQPAKAHLASVEGNTGNLSYSYPLQLPPGPDGLTPQLGFSYSSAAPNERHSPLTPADNLGDGWSLGMGSITAESYPSSSSGGAATWYSLSGSDGVSDKLIPDPSTIGSFYTENISHEKILGLNMSSITSTPSCFHVWDTSGTYYEYGCTPDSLQYIVDSTGTKSTYRWDLDLIVAPHEGPLSPTRQIKVSYFQNLSSDATGYTSVRDAVMAQVVYETVNGSTTTVAGTVDFQYRAPAVPSAPAGASSSWVTPYGTNYNCQSTPPGNTSLRCDDPYDDGSVKAPAVMSVFSLQKITTYVGADTANHPAYSYGFNYIDTPFTQITDPITLLNEYAAGEHLLTSIVPTQYLSGTAYKLKEVAFSYKAETNTYYDGEETASNGTTQYQVSTNWQYLDYYVDQTTNAGETITYKTAYSNTHGTPYVTNAQGTIIDDRHDPFYCTNQANNPDTSKRCTGNYAHPDDQTWSTQVVTVRSAVGKDSSDPNLEVDTYNYNYTLGAYGTYQTDYSGKGTFCSPAAGSPPPTGESDCTFDTYILGPPGGKQDQDWQDFYHGDFRGFAKVYTMPPDGDLLVQSYYTPEAWGTPASDSQNYQSGMLKKSDNYWGDAEVDGQLVTETVNQYSGNADFLPNGTAAYSNACISGVNTAYPPCEAILVFSKTTSYEQNGTGTTNAPWFQTTYTYDDYSTSGGLQHSGYHNILQKQITSSNAPAETEKWSYVSNNSVDSAHGNYVYYTVNTPSHHEIDDASGHIWQCEDTSYDQGVSGITTPAAGWPTTTTSYSDCNDPPTGSTTFTSYTGYDAYGNTVATVDDFATANSSLYTNNGCTLSTAPYVLTNAWMVGRYTSCSVYDSYSAQESASQNVLSQQMSVTYDDTQDRLPTSETNVTGQTTSVSYSIDSSGNQTLQVKEPGGSESYTTQSGTYSTCTFGSNRPCYEADDLSSLYPGAVSRTFYDTQGRATETRTPQDATHDLISFIVYNDWNDSTFVSEPFQVSSGSTWVDPNGAKDDQGNTPTGTITITDPLGRVVATRDPIEGTVAEPGITCGSGNVTGTWTTCTGFGLGSPNAQSSLYDYAVSIDANNHMAVTFSDALGHARFSKAYSVHGSINSNITTTRETQYNVLGQPTAVIMTDNAPQVGQSTTSVTASSTYDDMGQLISVNDPDNGIHTYSYDADGQLTTDVSGSRTIGTSYDLLGRVRCIQDAVPTMDGSGNCSSGSHPLIQDTYSTSYLQLPGTTDYSTNQLTQRIANTYYPDGTSSVTTQQFEHDQRGQVTATNLNISVPSSWNVTTALPTYQETQTYNDAGQPMTTQTTVGGQPGYIFSYAYDSTTGSLTGLSNNSVGIANLATESFGLSGQLSDLTFETPTATPTQLVDDHFTYDGDLRPVQTSASWLSGSASSGTIFQSSRVYDPVGNVISTSLVHAPVAGQSNSGGSDTENYCYDEQDRLVWAGNGGTEPSAGNGTCGSSTLGNSFQGAEYSSSYSYTHLGQIWQGPLNGTGSNEQYLYCNSSQPHQLTGLYPLGTSCSSLSGATYTSSYDSWGNVTSRSYNGTNAALSYNAFNELVQWNAGSTNQAWYAYNSTGDRVLQRTTTSGGTSLTVYAFGLEEHTYDASGNNTGNIYYYGLNGRLIGESDGTNTQFFLTDALGSVDAAFSSVAGTATTQGNQLYGPYGNLLYTSGSVGTTKGFTGQYGDATGLDYYNARYYDPVVGRFLSADNVQGDAQGMDPYAYAGNNPETNTDPTGQRILGSDGQTAWVNPENGSTYVDIPSIESFVTSTECFIVPAGLYQEDAGSNQFKLVTPSAPAAQEGQSNGQKKQAGSLKKTSTQEKARTVVTKQCNQYKDCPNGITLDLKKAENEGGHTLKKHVYRAPKDVVEDVRNKTTSTYDDFEGLFLQDPHDKDYAEQLAQKTLYAALAKGTTPRATPDTSWDGPATQLTYSNVDVGFPTGYVYWYDRNKNQIVKTLTKKVTIVIELTNTNCYVLTEHPSINKFAANYGIDLDQGEW